MQKDKDLKKLQMFEIELPDYFVYNGVTYPPGTHLIENENVFNDLTASKERLVDARKKEAEEDARRIVSLNVSGTSNRFGSTENFSMDQLQALVDQAVEAKTAELMQTVSEQQSRIEELEHILEMESDQEIVKDPVVVKSK